MGRAFVYDYNKHGRARENVLKMCAEKNSLPVSSKAARPGARVGRWLLALALACGFATLRETLAQQPQVLNDPLDVSQDFQRMEQVYFVGGRVKDFNATTGQGSLQWDRYLRSTTTAATSSRPKWFAPSSKPPSTADGSSGKTLKTVPRA